MQYNTQVDNPLTWDDSFAIALALGAEYPDVHLAEVSLQMIYRWTVALPDFADDRALANDQVLAAIYQEWYEQSLERENER